MKVVIDTNVLVSAVIRHRLPEQVLRWCLGNESVSWLVSSAIMAEYVKVIRRPRFALPPELIGWWSELLLSDTLMTPITAAPDFARDTKDACFLACAGTNGVDFLITGDADFTEALALLPTVRIVSVREFAQIVGLEPSA